LNPGAFISEGMLVFPVSRFDYAIYYNVSIVVLPYSYKL